MRFTVQIGGKEPSRVDVYRDPFLGTFRVLVDGELIAKRSAFSPFTHFTLPTGVHRYEFTVGKTERHSVVVEHERPFFLAGFRPQTFRVFVDGRLMHEQRGY
jgi:hypothetical protein